MDDFARLSRDERRIYFEQAAARLGMSAGIIERDFWVCWCLRRLFSIDAFRDHLTFKCAVHGQSTTKRDVADCG